MGFMKSGSSTKATAADPYATYKSESATAIRENRKKLGINALTGTGSLTSQLLEGQTNTSDEISSEQWNNIQDEELKVAARESLSSGILSSNQGLQQEILNYKTKDELKEIKRSKLIKGTGNNIFRGFLR